MTFVIMLDFNIRYPDSRSGLLATDMLISQLLEDLKRINKTVAMEKDRFNQDVYQFLKEKFPDVLEGSRKEELRLYLEF